MNVFKQKVLNWLRSFNTFCLLDSNQYAAEQELIVAAGSDRFFQSSKPDALSEFQRFLKQKPSWLFGHIAYELITSEKRSPSSKENPLQFPQLFFFEPEIVIQFKKNKATIIAAHPQTVFDAIIQTSEKKEEEETPTEVFVESKIDQTAYLAIIQQLKQHIQRGDCYEINFCQEFFSNHVTANPFTLYRKLNKVSPNPFSGLYRINDKWLICASPERYIKKEHHHIISQPIKGTLPRKPGTRHLKAEQLQLLHSEKDKAENVMAVDLVRNDLSKICEEGSVRVDELFGIYSFPQVHQMISTISGTLKKETEFSDIINATFPMGSMTGAPKVKVMELIHEYEKSVRGVFSGSLGYITPDEDFDFNVVIRSIMYNQSAQYLSFQAGSGITIYSDAEKEWEECMIKAQAIKAILND